MTEQLRKTLLSLGYTYYQWEDVNKETGNYHVNLLHSHEEIKRNDYHETEGEKRRAQQAKDLEAKTLQELEKAGYAVIKLKVEHSTCESSSGTYVNLKTDEKEVIHVSAEGSGWDSRTDDEDCISEITAYLELVTDNPISVSLE